MTSTSTDANETNVHTKPTHSQQQEQTPTHSTSSNPYTNNNNTPPPSNTSLCHKRDLAQTAPQARISHVQFGLFDKHTLDKLAEFEVVADRAYEMPKPESATSASASASLGASAAADAQQLRKPVRNGVLDRRLGVSDKLSKCETCGLRIHDCPGHFAVIKLALPVFHIGYLKPLIAVLQCICKECSRVLLPPPDRTRLKRALAHPMTAGDAVRLTSHFKRLVERCRKVRECPYCGARNGLVKKVGFARLVHERLAPKDSSPSAEAERAAFASSFDMACSATKGGFENAAYSGPDLRDFVGRARDDLSPLRVRTLLHAIPEADLPLLDMDGSHGRPESLLLEHLPVPPVPIRPSVIANAMADSNEDDLTVKLSQIVTVNNVIRMALEGGKATTAMVMEDWEYLQLQVAMYINGANVPGVRAEWQTEKKNIRAYAQRLKGKQGRFRGNLSGKRVDFSGRTVISPDPNFAIDEVGVPEAVARVLTYPERVTRHNLSDMRVLVLAGPATWPGANYVENGRGKRHLGFGDRRRAAAELCIGDTVERHLRNGDIVLFNRQPSLHKLSVMAHRARVVPQRTFRFNECVCAPYNADFDGDEMNLHLPQTEEARAEALALMSVHQNLVTPRNGEIVIAATQDFLTGAYLLSRPGTFLTRCQIGRLAAYLGDAAEAIELPPPAVLKPVEMWTGKQVFTLMLRPNADATACANLEGRTRSYNPERAVPPPGPMCPADGWVCFQDSELVCGTLDKALLGGGSKTGLLSVLLRDHSPLAAARAMERLARLTSRYLADYGFSIGIADVQPTEQLERDKGALVAAGYEACRRRISEFESGALQPAPGCSAEQTLESEINGALSRIRDDAGEICRQFLGVNNAPLCMATCGAKGSFINISQMVACVGQQSVGGRRMPNGFIHRALPHFPRHSREPPDKGFVSSSFYSGLSPTEFFFHTMGGREGLVDTAVKTAETGYMQRRLMKALEDLTVRYDGSVRNSEGSLVQFRYGDDRLEPACMEEKKGRPVSFERTLMYARATLAPEKRAAPPLRTRAELDALFRTFVESDYFDCVVRRGWLPLDDDAPRAGDTTPTTFEVELADFFDRIAVDHGLEAPAAAADAVSGEQRRRGGRGRKGVLLDDDEIAPLHLPNGRALTRPLVEHFLSVTLEKYRRSQVEAGTAVGAVGAQSIGEPGTQMTLKTFHFAGVASMNITLGVPRIKEIINAAKKVSTPIMKAELNNPFDADMARIVKGRIERTELGEVCSSLREVYDLHDSYVAITLDVPLLERLRLPLDADAVRRAILRAPRLRVADSDVMVMSPSELRIAPVNQDKTQIFELRRLKEALRSVLVSGIREVTRAIITQKEETEKTADERAAGKPSYRLVVEGAGLLDVMGVAGVRGELTRSTHIAEVERTLGIEAARRTITDEIQYTMGHHGMDIDGRHVSLLADVMTFRGEVLGITRFGVPKMKQSVFMLASFEKTTDHLFEAAVHSRNDPVQGVSECIIMGIPIPVGTGLFGLLQRTSVERPLPRGPPLLLPTTERRTARIMPPTNVRR